MTPDGTPSTRRCELWVGRAGSGKTHGCLAAIAQRLAQAPRGEPLLMLVPEQATAQMERRLLAGVGGGRLEGFTRARIWSFAHLAREALARSGHSPSRPLTETGRAMLLARILRRRRGELKILHPNASGNDLASVLGQTILEFQRYGWSREDLDRWLRASEEQNGAGGLLDRKSADLALLWRDLEEAAGQGGWQDSAQTLTQAAQAIAQWGELAGASLWVDGFSSFTVQEWRLLEALLGQCREAVIALCADPSPAAGSRVAAQRLFDHVLETYASIDDHLRSAGWTVKKVDFPRPGAPDRFAASPPLAHLERAVLGQLVPRPYVPREAAVPDSTWGPAIELIEADDPRAEVEAVARRIATLCRAEAAPPSSRPTWRDMGVLARDLAPYESVIREVFGQFRIPYFLDRPRQIEGHPLSRLLASALAAIGSGYAGQAAIDHLKCGLAGLRDPDAIARLENHILSTDTEGRGWLGRSGESGADPTLAPWELAATPLKQLERALRSGGSPARALWAFLEAAGAAPVLEGWIARERAAGQEELAQIHEQAWEQTAQWLEELDALFEADPEFFEHAGPAGGFREYIEELSDLVGSALATTKARLIPPTLNQVTVGSVDRSRTPEVAVLFVLGLNEGSFPRLWIPDPILSDGERERLGALGNKLGPDTRAKRLQEHYLAYIALTRPSRRLVLSRAAARRRGQTGRSITDLPRCGRGVPRCAVRRSQEGGRGR